MDNFSLNIFVKENLQIFLVYDDEGNLGGDVENCNLVSIEEVDTQNFYNSFIGLSLLGPTKLKGCINDNDFNVLVDCRVTCNFIYQELVGELELSLSITTYCIVVMGNDTIIRGWGMCQEVVLKVQGLYVIDDYLSLWLEMQWLKTLDFISVDWKWLQMKFLIGGTIVILRGNPLLYQ